MKKLLFAAFCSLNCSSISANPELGIITENKLLHIYNQTINVPINIENSSFLSRNLILDKDLISNKDKIGDLYWNFIVTGIRQTGVKFSITKSGDEYNPKSVINVIVKGKKTLIKEISGEATIYEATDYAKYKIPKNAIGACGAWWAGQGQYFYILPLKDGISVYEGYEDEQVPNKGDFHWKKIKTIK